MMINRRFIILFLLITGLVFTRSIYAQEEISGVVAIYNSALKDMRVVGALQSRSANQPVTKSNLRNLKVGDIFINEDNAARIVTSIYTGASGQTVIETSQPRPEDVIDAIYVPDFQQDLTMDHLVYLADGVEAISARTADDPQVLFPDAVDAHSRSSVHWMETDDRISALQRNGNSIKSFRLNLTIPIPIYSGDGTQDMQLREYIKKAKEAYNTGNPAAKEEGEEKKGGESELSFTREIKVQGILRFIGGVEGGLLKPSLKISWSFKFFIPLPRFEFTRGYVKFNTKFAEQLDLNLNISGALKYEYKYVLASFIVTDPGNIVSAQMDLVWKTSIEGKLSIGLELSEYAFVEVEAGSELVWPFFPKNVGASSPQSYFNVCFRPTIAAEVDLTTGLYPGAGIKILGLSVVEVGVGAGPYFNVLGYMEPMNVIGYSTSGGRYGNFHDWIAYIKLEAGAFFTSGVKLLGIFDFDIWKNRWPFWTWTKNWEF